MMKSKTSSQPQKAVPEVSIVETLLRTVGLVGLTLAFAAVFRFWHPTLKLVQMVAATHAWQWLYTLFHVDSALGREQMILIGIIVFCFCAALIVQIAVLSLIKVIRSRS
ncbi:hypothetical protein AA0228_2213 [Gluconobacter frateurii NRIC 0228]|uniref:Uncharacterized protein n=1 Tax=Gluconobacter frateurii NRIC 0228 TaxID=1307946 RepID=A0ABQ0QDF3_9PROT|nr:hypothetical protein AA0228_2213 [Gluconobacter frateurii NRIC 0228]